MKKDLIKYLKFLTAYGFALHWLRPKSKIPIEKGWNEGPRHSLGELIRQYKPGFNLGVRLGLPSKLKNGAYLTIIDFDIKSSEEKHLLEAQYRLEKLYPDIALWPCVASGRGNGSRHFFASTLTPPTTIRLFQSIEKVKVFMPSVRPSQQELLALSDDEIKKGMRLRSAYEAMILGTGAQAVLPPSIHPDSNKNYEWIQEFDADVVLDIIEAVEVNRIITEMKSENIEFESLDLENSNIPYEIIEAIIKGEGVENRSDYLLKAAISMYRAGLSDNQIISVLTERGYYLGEVAYDHTKSDSRYAAADWIRRYTLPKAKEVCSTSQEDFNIVVEDTEETEWPRKIVRNKNGKPTSSFLNIKTIIDNSVGGKILAKNEFSQEETWIANTPWGSKKGESIQDSDAIMIKDWLAQKWQFEPSRDRIDEVIIQLARSNTFHPVREYLEKLEWDGVPRLNNWLIKYLNANGPEKYLRAVGKYVLLAMIKRIYEPGCKFDQVLILEGRQGIGKSTALKILAHPWHSDAYMNIADKDSVLNLQGTWIYELGELSAMRRAEINTLKDFITRTTDRIRPPYGKRKVEYHRQSVFIGTTNSNEYLKDSSGNRRFWPVSVNKINLAALKKDRDQLLAEAYRRYHNGERKLYIRSNEIKILESQEQKRRLEFDEIESELIKFFASSEAEDLEEFHLSDLTDRGFLNGRRADHLLEKRICKALRSIGFDNQSRWDKDLKINIRKWRRLEPNTKQ